MHSVFSTTLQTDRGKKFVRENEDGFDDQEVCKKLDVFYETSVGARLNASEIINCTTSAKFEYWKTQQNPSY